MQRMKITRRTLFSAQLPGAPSNGTTFGYRREINGTPYDFTFVVMPDGERRYFVRRYNGYLQDLNREQGMKFACAWTQVHAIIVPPIMNRTEVWSIIGGLHEKIGEYREVGPLANDPASIAAMFKLVRAHVTPAGTLPDEFVVGVLDFRVSRLALTDEGPVFYAGRELAHIMTGRRFDEKA